MISRRQPYASQLTESTLALVMAGGQGTRLGELTRWHAKPALPFGGQYRNIDFALSNCVNSGVRRIAILTQYMAHSLIQHVQRGWTCLSPELGEFVEVWPAQQRSGSDWYAGTADAVQQNIDLIEQHAPERVLVLAGDHVYRMDYAEMIATHTQAAADITIGGVGVAVTQAHEFGIMGVDANGRVTRFDEKPADPVAMPSDPLTALASMGIYVFDREFLVDCLEADARDPESGHDFGHDILPRLIGRARVFAHSFRDTRNARPGYWRDVGTIDAYWQAHMELLADEPAIDFHDDEWPIRTHLRPAPPPRFTGESSVQASIVANGCRVAGRVERSVVSTGARVDAGASVARSVVLPDARIGRDCRIRRAIIDSGCDVPDGTVIGDDLLTASSPFFVSPHGVVLVTAEMLEAAGISGRSRRRVA